MILKRFKFFSEKLEDEGYEQSKRNKLFSWFSFGSKMDLYDFFDAVEECNYPNKSKNLKKYSMDWDSTYSLINKIDKKQSEKIKEILKRLDKEITTKLNANSLGKTDNWSLYAVYLDSNNGKISLGCGLECVKPLKNCEKGCAIELNISL